MTFQDLNATIHEIIVHTRYEDEDVAVLLTDVLKKSKQEKISQSTLWKIFHPKGEISYGTFCNRLKTTNIPQFEKQHIQVKILYFFL